MRPYREPRGGTRIRAVAGACLLLALAACGSSGGTAPSSDASLSGLTISVGAISPAFGASTTAYTVDVAPAGGATTVTPTATDGGASITVQATAVLSGAASAAIPLPVGPTTLTVIVTAADGATTRTYTVTVTRLESLDLIDPTPGAEEQFGSWVLVLANDNIVVTDYFDSSVVANGGAVHLYSPHSSTPIGSIYGDAAEDRLGFRRGTALSNGDFVVSSPLDDVGGVGDAGSVRLMSGTTGLQIGPTLAGDVAGDSLGDLVTALSNGDFVVASPFDREGGIQNAGSVRLMSGTTGLQIGPTLAGDVVFDRLGSSGVTELANGDFVVSSLGDDEGGIQNAGSVRLMSGTTGLQIGPTLAGDIAGDSLSSTGVTALSNGDFVVSSPLDDEGGLQDAGSVRLVSGTTGLQIGPTLAGDVTGDSLGSSVTALSNGDFVVVSRLDDEGGVVNAGSVRLMSGTTGLQIGPTLAGDVALDLLGSPDGVTALSNGDFVVASQLDDEGGVVNSGSVRLVSGTTGLQIGPALAGDVADDQLGSSGVTALANGDFVVSSLLDDEGGVVNAGSVRLMSGATGLQIGPTLAGDVANDQLGSRGATALSNGDFVVASSQDDEGGVVDAGSVRLMSGTTGLQIGPTLTGDVASNKLGFPGATALPNSNFVVASDRDDEGGVVDAGSVRLVSGTTGVQIGSTFAGGAAGDVSDAKIVPAPPGSAFFVVALRLGDNIAGVNSGRVVVRAN